MKKQTIIIFVVLSILSLTACSSQKSTHVNSEKKVSTSKQNYAKEKQQIIEVFNKKNVSIRVDKNEKDSDFPKGYDNIKVELVGETKKELKTSITKAKKKKATKEEYNKIYEIRKNTSNIAKKLPNNKSAITVIVKLSNDKMEVIAKSSKAKNFIPVGKPAE